LRATLFDSLRARGEEVFNRISQELLANPSFMRAMQAAWRGKEKLDQAVAQAVKGLNIPTRAEFNRAVQRIGELEAQLAGLKTARKRGSAHARPARPRRARKPKPGSRAPGA
jgi:hypothetical protein